MDTEFRVRSELTPSWCRGCGRKRKGHPAARVIPSLWGIHRPSGRSWWREDTRGDLERKGEFVAIFSEEGREDELWRINQRKSLLEKVGVDEYER